MTTTAYRLVAAPLRTAPAPVLDPSQRAVVEHPGGPLLVLAGPGTGKTTTLVEAVVDRVARGMAPEHLLVLTFSRKAADELRERIVSRLGRTVTEPPAYTFHGFCAWLVATYGEGVPRLLSGPERLVRIRELLRGNHDGLGTGWPDRLRPCLLTKGFAEEVADFLDRARERALVPNDLRAIAGDHDAWRAVAEFWEEYAEVLGGREMDYAALVDEALRLCETDLVLLAELRDRFRAVFVDEYQDTDPSQERLLGLLAGDGRDLVVVGDPDQSIYAFRGADVSCVLRFADRFPSGGEPAPVLTLGVSRRAGSVLLDASRAVAARLPTPGLAVHTRQAHRALVPDTEEPGEVAVRLFGTDADEAAAIADLLRQAHLRERMPWRRMAVLIRSGVRSIPVLRRTLVAAGVPVTVASDELPVAQDPAVAPLLLALRAADSAGTLTPDVVEQLLYSPLIRATPAEVRRLGRALRAEQRTANPAGTARPSAELVAEAVREPARLAAFDTEVAAPAARLAGLLDTSRTHEGSAEEMLWELWESSGWQDRLVELSRRGGQRGRAADRDLDAIVALFEAVARVEDRQPKVGVQVLLDELEAQEIPSSSRNEGGGLDAGAVRLLTAHRSKGLEWDLVVVAGVNDGSWPDLRRRSSVLEADRLGRDGVVEPAGRAQLLVDERRLFYVAVTRARRRLVVTAVSGRDETGTQPSRFVEDLCVDALGMETLPPVEKVGDQLLSPSALVGRVRRVAVAEAGDAVRRHAATVLARLAQPLPDGRRAVAAAHPARWWGLRDRTEGPGPVRPPDEPVRLSASAVKGYDECPLAWFLGREVGASGPSGPSQGFGVVLHALAKLVSSGELPPDLDVLDAQLDKVWNALGFEARWHAAQERERAREALARFLDWHAANPYSHVGSEVEFRKVPVAGAELTGSIDRVDRDADGRLVLVDYKTGKSEVSQEAAEEDLQLGVYQVVAEEGGLGGGPAEVAGASLVYLRKPHSDDVLTTRRQPGRADWPEDFAGRAVARAVTGILAEEFPARPNKNCAHCAFANSCPAQDEGRQVVE